MDNQEEKRSMTTCDQTEEEIKTHKKKKKHTFTNVTKMSAEDKCVCCKINLQINTFIKFLINFRLILCTRSPRVTNKIGSVGFF